MPEDNVPATSESLGELISETVSALKSIPGAVKAISRLVTGAGEAGAAWLDVIKAKGEHIASTIRDDKAAATRVSKALAAAASQHAVGDADIVERATHAWLSAAVRKQSNKEAIAREAIADLEADPPPEDTAGPADDWMNHFERFAEDASSGRMRTLWARLLACEIRKPGSFSLVTLQYMSTIDMNMANAIERALPYVLDDAFIQLDRSPTAQIPMHLHIYLEQIQFLNLSSGMLKRQKSTDENNAIWFTNGDSGFILYFKDKKTIDLKAVLLTIPGSEISKLLNRTGDIKDLASQFWIYKPDKILYGKIIRLQHQMQMPNAIELQPPKPAPPGTSSPS